MSTKSVELVILAMIGLDLSWAIPSTPCKLCIFNNIDYDAFGVKLARPRGALARIHSYSVLKGVLNEEAEGFLSYRVADRRGDHSDHRGHRNSNLIKSKMAANESSAVVLSVRLRQLTSRIRRHAHGVCCRLGGSSDRHWLHRGFERNRQHSVDRQEERLQLRLHASWTTVHAVQRHRGSADHVFRLAPLFRTSPV